MKKSKSTSIINITSFAYKDGWVGEAAFAAGASSVCHMTRPLAMQLKNHGIRVNTIAYNWLQDTTGDYTFREIHNFLIRERNRNACDGFLNHLANKNIETTNQKNEPFSEENGHNISVRNLHLISKKQKMKLKHILLRE